MATSNFYTAKMTTTSDNTISQSSPKKAKKTSKKTTKKLVKEEKPEETSDNTEDTETGDDSKSEETTDEIKTIYALLKETKTEITITPKGFEAPGLDKSGNKMYKTDISIENENGNIHYILWSKSESKMKDKDVLKDLVDTLEKSKNIKDIQSFRKEFGFMEADEARAEKAFDGMRQTIKLIDKMFPEDMKDKLIELVTGKKPTK